MSSADNNDNMFEEEVEEEVEEEPRQPTAAASGSKRHKSSSTAKSTSDVPPVKKVRKPMAQRSVVWAHFIKQTDNEGMPNGMANCRHCGSEIGCDPTKNGTSTMRGHMKLCKLLKAHEEAGSQPTLGTDPSGVMTTNMRHDKELFRRSVNEMIVLNELPFSFVESEGFRRFCLNLLPMYHVHCRKTATKDIFAMFLQAKVALKKLFTSEKKRVSLTTDIWVAPTTSCSYMVVTAHWIDANWVMQKRIIYFKPVIDHKGETIASHLVQCLEEWGIEKVFTITVDNAKANDKALGLFMDAFRLKQGNALIRDGKFLHMRCCAHILNLIVRDGLAHVRKSVVAIRNAVRYVRSSGTRYKSFELRVETGNVSRGSLCLDVVTRWNSTYLMLSAALKLRVAFQKMLEEDMPYNEYFFENETDEDGIVRELPPQKRIGPPKYSDWEDVAKLVKFLKIFFNCTLAFSASKSVTSSMCYNEIYIVEKNLIGLSTHSDGDIRNQARSMRDKFDKYWDGIMNMNPLMKFTWSNEVYMEMDNEVANEELCCELDIYLMEKPVKRAQNSLGLDFDVLAWWRRNSQKYPILAELARDILAVQVSSVASESAFSTSGRILDPFRSCLTPYMTEALVCTQQWLRNSIAEDKLANLAEMFEELKFHDSLTSETCEEPVP